MVTLHPMRDRLSPLDASFLALERGRTPAHIGSLSIFSPTRAGFDYDALVQLVEERISRAPRYRQKVRTIPGGVARPVWVDDNDFDIGFHVRRSALPSPGEDAQLHELVSRLMSRRLDRSRPLWELYLVEGLAGGRLALIAKTHEAMVSGPAAPALDQVILDDSARPRSSRGPLWMPAAEPGRALLLAEVLTEMLQRPAEIVDVVRTIARDATTVVNRVSEGIDTVTAAVGSVASAMHITARPAPPSPLNVTVSRQRRFAVARTRLADYRTVHTARGVAVNDVVLAVVSGAIRNWLLTRGERLDAASTVRALTPMSVAATDSGGSGDSAAEVGAAAGDVYSLVVDLPVGESSPLLRLGLIAQATRAHAALHRPVRARLLIELSGFAPPTLHAMGARVAGSLARRSFNVLVSNVPGPQAARYAAGARLLEMFPIVALAPNQALTIGLTSYDGKVCFGLNGDRDALPDLDRLAELIEEALAELVQAAA